MVEIEYVHGDATRPVRPGTKIIAHVCNDIGKWGKGFVLAISKRWAKPATLYKAMGHYRRGYVQFVDVESDVFVANMIAQEGIYKKNGKPPIRYDDLREALKKVFEFAREKKASVHMPRIGCGLAGGKWSIVEKIIKDELSDKDIPVVVYDWP